MQRLDAVEHTLESVLVQGAPNLQPTLWRTCRVVANHTRLEIFRFLLQQPEQTVSAVARHFDLSLSLSSEYLRLLESRSLLRARRVGRWVKYRTSPINRANPNSGLVAALRGTFQQDPKPTETIFRVATAFTHPRRIDIFRALQASPRTLGQLRAATGISVWALRRHFGKLEARGFATHSRSLYSAVEPSDILRRELVRLMDRRATG